MSGAFGYLFKATVRFISIKHAESQFFLVSSDGREILKSALRAASWARGSDANDTQTRVRMQALCSIDAFLVRAKEGVEVSRRSRHFVLLNLYRRHGPLSDPGNVDLSGRRTETPRALRKLYFYLLFLPP